MPRYLSPSQAKLQSKYGSDVIDPFIVTITVFPPDSFVKLTDGTSGLLVKANGQERFRPVIMLYERNVSHHQAAIIDLSREPWLSNERGLDPKTLPERYLMTRTYLKLKNRCSDRTQAHDSDRSTRTFLAKYGLL